MSFTPIDKRSKRAQKEWYSAQRRDGYGCMMVTKVVPSKKIYKREKVSYNFD